MTQKRPLITLTDGQTIAWYQHNVQILHGYTLALALQANLSPAEAARVFVEPWHGTAHLQSQATVQILEQQAWQIAEALALTHGIEHVQVDQQGNTWLIKVEITDREPFERYGASIELHTQWVAEQLRLICRPKGIVCSIWLDKDVQYIQLTLQADE